jgi:hypothetical protein
MRKIYCDLGCGKELGSVDKRGVTSMDDKYLSVTIGREQYPEICSKCYTKIMEFVQGMNK